MIRKNVLIKVVALATVLMLFMQFPVRAESIDNSRFYQDPFNSNVYYFVGMVYYDVWRNSAGDWTGDGYKPGDTVSRVDGGTYEFTFPAGRKVKSLDVAIYDFNWIYADETFNKSRTGELAINNKGYYQNATSTSPYNYANGQVIGKGTNSVKIDVFVVNGVLRAIEAVDRKQEEEEKNNQQFAPGVLGYRYFFPTLFTIELEPTEGKAIIKHYTTEGQSLDGVDGFRDREEKIELNEHYTFFPSPNTATYQYKGYTKGTNAPLPNDPVGMLIGNPMGFTYDGGYPIFYLNLYYEGDPPPPGGGGGGNGSMCTAPSPGRTMSGEDFSPNVSAVIKADSRGNEQFNVLQGIPTSDSLYGNVWTKDYLHKFGYQEMNGTCTFTVDVTVMPPPPPPGEDAGEPSTVQVQVDKDYSYWTITQVEVYEIKEAALWNYAFNGNGIRIAPSGYNAPYYATAQTNHYEPADIPSVSVSHDGDPEAAARSAVSVKVRNDTFTFYNQTLMSGSQTTNSGPSPSPIPTAPMTSDNVLYSPRNVIPTSKINKKDQASTGTIYYVQVNGSLNQDHPIPGINTVTVHTPVVDYAYVSDDKAHNQKTKPNLARNAFILERPFSVTIPTRGQHHNYLNYGNRDYRKWTRDRQVRFEFGVLTRKDDNSSYIAPGTWISFPADQDTMIFYMPVWVDEGDYNVYTRAIAENAPADFTHETEANMNLANHVATKTLPVEVIGRIYDFRVSDIADFSWEQVFRQATGSALATGAKYPVGDKGIDGDPNGFVFPYELPVRRGSHPNKQYTNAAVKLGYHFKFDLKTKGNMFSTYDSIRITPSFTFVDLQGNRQPVDLYYHTEKENFIKVGSMADVQKRYVTLDARLRNVPGTTIQATAGTLYDLFAAQSGWKSSREEYIAAYAASAKKPKYIGGYSAELITAPLRTFLGGFDVPAGVPAARKNAAIQQWYGEYSLPANTYAVPRNTNIAEYGRTNRLNDNSPIFLKKGFIIVNFDIMSIRDGKLDEPHLQYINTGIREANQWKREGFKYQITDPYGLKVNLKDGDIIFYNADKSSSNDYTQSKTH